MICVVFPYRTFTEVKLNKLKLYLINQKNKSKINTGKNSHQSIKNKHALCVLVTEQSVIADHASIQEWNPISRLTSFSPSSTISYIDFTSKL